MVKSRPNIKKKTVIKQNNNEVSDGILTERKT